MSEDLASRYKSTVTLPSTQFPMKANLSQSEPDRLAWWEKNSTYKKMIERNRGHKKFVMPDGPPYANANIHVGHVLNKVLKDIIIKYRNMKGEMAAFIPGWDCHGLPIELNVTKKLGAKRASTTEAEVRSLCRTEALTWVEKQREQFKRLGILADWQNPYLTLQPEYEAEEIRVLAQIVENGVLYRGEKPVFWDPALRTAMAAAEVEYQNHRSLSVYVKFPLTEATKKKLSINERSVSVVIWTTTPWTLPANYGICLNENFKYGLFRSGQDHLILAEDLAESFAQKAKLELTKIRTFGGADFENLEAQHPFMPRTSKLILGSHVTLDAGTGCVHTAPGHGADDYVVGMKYDLPISSPVDEAGKFTSDVPEWAGQSIFEANSKIVEKLKATGFLLASEEIEHQYPYGPRSKKPLIFRATPQWFIRLDDPEFNVRAKCQDLIEKQIQFVPDWGIQRMRAMVANSPDWCLSRQRTWGVPIPVFYCESCGNALVNAQVMRKVADKMESTGRGIEAYFEVPAQDFTSGHRCSSCGSSGFKRGSDILDVWFDSGICHTAVQRRRPDLGFPADVYIEGSDQHRGWFQTSLVSSVAAYSEAPFKALVTHGFVVDAQGFKMSKSVGNVVDPAEVIKESGAEILRLWVAHEDFGDDLNISKEMLTRVSDTYRRFRNTLRFMLGNLSDFDPARDRVPVAKMPTLDQWALARFAEVIDRCREAYDKFEFYKVYHALNSFFTVDLSATYLDILKDRLYTAKKEGLRRRASQTVIYELCQGLCTLMAPILSFLAEETYSYLPGEKRESIFLLDLVEARAEWKNPSLVQRFEHLLAIRGEASKILEDLRRAKTIGSSLEAQLKIEASGEALAALESERDQLAEFFIVSEVSVKSGTLSVKAESAKGEKCVRCWRFDQKTNSAAAWPGLCPKCVEALS